jgi:hypothetical protein
MTVSAPVRLSPAPPALSEMRNTGIESSRLKRSTRSIRSLVDPSRYSYFTPSRSIARRMSVSISTNCENTSVRCPDWIASEMTSISESSLPESSSVYSPGSLRSRGSHEA